MDFRVVDNETIVKLKLALACQTDEARPILSGVFFNAKHMIAANGYVVNIQDKPEALKDLVGLYRIKIIGRMPGGTNRVILVEPIETGQKYPDIYTLIQKGPGTIEVCLNRAILADICKSPGFSVKMKIYQNNAPVQIEVGAEKENHYVLMPVLYDGLIKMPDRPVEGDAA